MKQGVMKGWFVFLFCFVSKIMGFLEMKNVTVGINSFSGN